MTLKEFRAEISTLTASEQHRARELAKGFREMGWTLPGARAYAVSVVKS